MGEANLSRVSPLPLADSALGLVSISMLILASCGTPGLSHTAAAPQTMTPSLHPTHTNEFTPSPQVTATREDFPASWQSYVSEEIGITIRFPPNWTVTELPRCPAAGAECFAYPNLRLLPPEPEPFAVYLEVYLHPKPFDDFREALLAGPSPEYTVTSFDVGGRTALRHASPSSDSRELWVPGSEGTYVLATNRYHNPVVYLAFRSITFTK
jgi:hypothetical protein